MCMRARRTRRTWRPNVHWQSLFSETLGERVRVLASTKALRCVDKAGGLDNYLLRTNEKLLPGVGMRLKERLLAAMNPSAAAPPGGKA